jgi:hypothetical protein
VLKRPARFALLLFQAIWFNVIVPGHTRGIVQLPGSTSVQSCPSCCCETSPGTNNSKSTPPANRTGNCAICFFAAHLTIPPTIDLSLPRLNFLHRLNAEIAEKSIPFTILLTFDSRGPPTFA